MLQLENDMGKLVVADKWILYDVYSLFALA